MATSISVEGYDGAIAGAYPMPKSSPPCVRAFVFCPSTGSYAVVCLSPVNALALASALAGAAEYTLPSSELAEAEDQAAADELEEF